MNTYERSLGPTTAYILEEIKKRRIPYHRFAGTSLITLGYGRRQRRIRTAITGSTSALGLELAGDKDETKQLLAEAHLPVPAGIVIRRERELEEALTRLRYPLVIKPLNGNHGRGVTTNIHSHEKAIFGYHLAKDVSDEVVVEEFIAGDDYRFLVINYKLVAVAKRTPAYVTGDGVSTIRALIEEENKNPDRGNTPEHVLAPIEIDEVMLEILGEHSLALDSILPKGKILYLKYTANISAGGTSIDVTDSVHPENVFMAERVARLFNLDICGIDVIVKDITQPLTRENGAIIEVNAGPGLRMHTNPTSGTPRDIAKPIIEMLFPDGESRVPVVAVQGKYSAVVTELIAFLAKHAGHQPGFTIEGGVFIQEHTVCRPGNGECPDPVHAVLLDPTIDFAVIECRAGTKAVHELDQWDVSVILDAHDTQLADALVQKTPESGFLLLNADDDKAYELSAKLLHTQVLLFSATDSQRVHMHCVEQQGWGAVVRGNRLVVYNGSTQVRSEEVQTLPGLPQEVVLPAFAAAAVLNFEADFHETLRAFAVTRRTS